MLLRMSWSLSNVRMRDPESVVVVAAASVVEFALEADAGGGEERGMGLRDGNGARCFCLGGERLMHSNQGLKLMINRFSAVGARSTVHYSGPIVRSGRTELIKFKLKARLSVTFGRFRNDVV